MTMKIITPNLPERYIAELDEIVAQHYAPNRTEGIRLAIHDYLMGVNFGELSLLEEGRPSTKPLRSLISRPTLTRVNRLVKLGYETSRARIIRNAVRLFSDEKYKRPKNLGLYESIIAVVPVKMMDMLDKLVEDGCYDARCHVAESALDVYLNEIGSFDGNYPHKARSITLHMLLGDIKMLDWLVNAGYVLNRSEAIKNAIHDNLLEMKRIMAKKPIPIRVRVLP